MAGESWIERNVSLIANQVLPIQSDHNQQMNTFIVKNLTDAMVYASLRSTVSEVDYEIQVQPGDYGMIVRPYNFDNVFLFSTTNLNLTVYLVRTDNPMVLLPSMAKPIQATNVSVLSTVGLKAGDLNTDSQKNIGVILKNDVSLSGVNGGKWGLSQNTVTIKNSAGKVYGLKADVDISLLDGSTEKWSLVAGEKDTFVQPIICTNSVKIKSEDTGNVWVLYL